MDKLTITHMYPICSFMTFAEVGTQMLQPFTVSHASVSRTPAFQVLRARGTKLTSRTKDRLDAPSVVRKASLLQLRTCCQDQAYSSCHRSNHTRDTGTTQSTVLTSDRADACGSAEAPSGFHAPSSPRYVTEMSH